MRYYLSVDGGGTKIRAILFDENFTLLGMGQGGGVNTNFIPRDIVRDHMQTCIEQCFAGVSVPEVELAFLTIIGPKDLFLELLKPYTTVKESKNLGEASCYLYSGACVSTGATLLSGTGSGAAFVKDFEIMMHLGGYGSWIGDEGSGYYIGRAAFNAVTRYVDGWGPATMLEPLLREYLGGNPKPGFVFDLYKNPNPHHCIAGFCPSVSKAAAEGDAVALDILRDAGTLLARLAASLGRRCNIEPGTPLVLSGGTFGCGAPMIDPLVERLAEEAPNFVPCRARFHSVLGGPAFLALQQKVENPTALLAEKFPQYDLQK